MRKPYRLTAGASQNNAFTRPYNGVASIFARDPSFCVNVSERATKAREETEKKGINVAQIPGMGSRTFKAAERSSFHVSQRRALDQRGRAVVSMAPRTTGSISLAKAEGQAGKTLRIRKPSSLG